MERTRGVQRVHARLESLMSSLYTWGSDLPLATSDVASSSAWPPEVAERGHRRTWREHPARIDARDAFVVHA